MTSEDTTLTYIHSMETQTLTLTYSCSILTLTLKYAFTNRLDIKMDDMTAPEKVKPNHLYRPLGESSRWFHQPIMWWEGQWLWYNILWYTVCHISCSGWPLQEYHHCTPAGCSTGHKPSLPQKCMGRNVMIDSWDWLVIGRLVHASAEPRLYSTITMCRLWQLRSKSQDAGSNDNWRKWRCVVHLYGLSGFHLLKLNDLRGLAFCLQS